MKHKFKLANKKSVTVDVPKGIMKKNPRKSKSVNIPYPETTVCDPLPERSIKEWIEILKG